MAESHGWVNLDTDAPLHCLACDTTQRPGMPYLAFVHAHADCEAPS